MLGWASLSYAPAMMKPMTAWRVTPSASVYRGPIQSLMKAPRTVPGM